MNLNAHYKTLQQIFTLDNLQLSMHKYYSTKISVWLKQQSFFRLLLYSQTLPQWKDSHVWSDRCLMPDTWISWYWDLGLLLFSNQWPLACKGTVWLTFSYQMDLCKYHRLADLHVTECSHISRFLHVSLWYYYHHFIRLLLPQPVIVFWGEWGKGLLVW